MAGSAGTSTMYKSGEESDESTNMLSSGRKFFPQDRGTPDYEEYMRSFNDSDDFMFKCLGNAVSQSFMLSIDEEVHRTLTLAGVTHDVSGSVTCDKTGKVLHTM